MELRLQPKPEIDIEPANKGIVSREKFFVKKVLEEINEYFYPGHLIRNWRPKADLIYSNPSDETDVRYECDFNRAVQNCFVEDFAEEVYLRSPPPCFVILGKSGPNVEKLGRELAGDYGSVHIHVDNVVRQVLDEDSETAKYLRKVLRVGVALTGNIVLSLVSYLAHTSEAKHRGYVLSGFPLASFSSSNLSAKQQLDYLFCWENKPTLFVHVLFEDEDLLRARSQIRYEVSCSSPDEEESILIRHLEADDDDDDEDDDVEGDEGTNKDDDDSEDEVDRSFSPEPDINISPSRPWIRLPRDEKSFVWAELELFDATIKPALDLLATRVDPQYFITVDSRVHNEFEIVKSWLSLLQVWKVPVPFPFIPLRPHRDRKEVTDADEDYEANDGDDEDDEDEDDEVEDIDEDIKNVADEPPEKAFTTLFAKNTPSAKFRWELSHYNYICPVSLRSGEVVVGKSRYAVVFMKYIYFLKDEDAMKLFLKNPRPFVLPIRPKPPTRFFIIGYPYCGKTTLAQSFSEELSVPLLDLNRILKTDLDEKKSIYMEFCRQKAEEREIVRLTTQVWSEWRMEEEQRLSVIEDWMEYVRTLLNQRIEEFYSAKTGDETPSSSPTLYPEGEGEGEKQKPTEPTECGVRRLMLQVHGVPIELDVSDIEPNDSVIYTSYSTPSAKIMKALKHEDYDFDKKGFEVEANLFFSALWNGFTKDKPEEQESCKRETEKEKPGEDDEDEENEQIEDGASNRSLAGEEYESVTSINWCDLLPPQSLSSLLLKKKPYTTREKRKSFRLMLSAASKAYHNPDSLRVEFAKWRLPCFMDIPLCEILVDNPSLLYKYCPDWIKHMPLMPDPIDPNHPAVIEAGRVAYARSKIVTLQHTTEEVGILLRNAIEKVERNGMRVTGDVITPGGWVVDNMVLDLQVWCMLLKANIVPTHVYCMHDSTPEFRRIINTWNDLYEAAQVSELSIQGDSSDSALDLSEKEIDEEQYGSEESVKHAEPGVSNESPHDVGGRMNLADLLAESFYEIAKGEDEIDFVFEKLINDDKLSNFDILRASMTDPFSHGMMQDQDRKSCDLTDEFAQEESILTTNLPSAGRIFFSNHPSLFSTQDLILGAQLEKFTSKVLNLLQGQNKIDPNVPADNLKCYQDGAKFFFLLLAMSQRLDELTEWLNSANRDIQFVQVDVNGKTPSQVFAELFKELFVPFGKKPRELESFEAEEIDRFLNYENTKKQKQENEEQNEGEGEGEEEIEDVCIYGESGPFCIVNLERNILLYGNPSHALRYYGKLYFFWNKESKSKFLEDPEKYAPYYSPIRALPPPRIFLAGPFGGNKTVLGKSISNQCGIHFVDYLKFLSSKLIPHVSPALNKLTALNVPLLVSESHNAEAKKALAEFKGAPYKKRKFWLENPPFYTDLWNNDEAVKEFLNLKKPNVATEDVNLTYLTIDVDETETETETDESIRRNSVVQMKESKPFLSMNEIKDVLNRYVHENGTLNDHCIDKSLKALWNCEPFTTKGFILKDFPLRSSDGRIIMQNNWIPDLVIEVSINEDDAVNRNIDRIMETWDVKLNQQIVKEQLLEDSVKTIYETKALLRRLELMYEKEDLGEKFLEGFRHPLSKNSSIRRMPENLEKSSLKSRSRDERKGSMRPNTGLSSNALLNVSSLMSTVRYTETASNPEIDEVIRREFPPLAFNPKFESYDEGKARALNDITENYRKDAAELAAVKKQLVSMNVPWLEVRYPVDNRDVFILLDAYKKRIDQRGEFAFRVSEDMAETLLSQGFYFLSKFGRFCPVQAHRRRNPIHMYRPQKSRRKICPIAYRNYIYFIGGEKESSKFLENPLKYTFNEPHCPNVPLRVSVIGPPKSGKSTLCRRLSVMFGLKVMTVGTAIRFVLEEMADSALKRSIDACLKKGCFLPLSLKVEALTACLNDPACLTQGFVFDGVPFDAAMAQSLAERRKLPFVIICLRADAGFGKRNRQNLDLSLFRLSYKQRVNLDVRYKEWEETYNKFRQWNEATYHNLYEIPAKSSLMDIFYQAFDIIKKPYFGILNYVENCVTDKALNLQYLCVNQQEFDLRKTILEDSCPVCWTELHRLESTVENKRHLGLVYHLGFIYWVCSSHMDQFLRQPKRYMPPNVSDWPIDRSRRISKTEFEAMESNVEIHGFGRCPVTRLDLPQSLNWEGSWDHAAIYKDEIFLCRNEEMLERFLSRPWRYCGAQTVFEGSTTTKSKAVENLGPLKITSLPPIGFLEQTVATIIHKALHLVAAIRPVYPQLTPECTACVFVALYLKVHNKPQNSRPCLEKEYFDFMSYYCKATRFRVSFCVPRQTEEEGQGDNAIEIIESSESTNRVDDVDLKSSWGTIGSAENLSTSQDDGMWTDLESQADKKLWSAKFKDPNYTEMILNSDDELQEMFDVPLKQVVLRYRTIRNDPLPPVPNCLTFLYCRKPNLVLPEDFNVNTLYQPPPAVDTPYPSGVAYNPDRQFSIFLRPTAENGPHADTSTSDICRGKKTHPDTSDSEEMKTDQEDSVPDLPIHRFVPRFKLFDFVRPVEYQVPTAVEYPPVIYEPQRDYTYIMLLSHFFGTSNVVKCFEWKSLKAHHEYTSLYDRNLGLCNARSRFFYKPERRPSEKTNLSMLSYQSKFDACNTFFIRAYQPGKESSDEGENEETSSAYNFLQALILDQLDEVFARLSVTDLSYDSYEVNVLSVGSEINVKPVLLVREVLPSPPLIWDIVSRPYYAYESVPSVFATPRIDNIAHERHVSLLDGIMEPNDTFRFVRYPTWVQQTDQTTLTYGPEDANKRKRKQSKELGKTYLVFDFFHLNWTSFLCCPLSWVYDSDVTANFKPPAD